MVTTIRLFKTVGKGTLAPWEPPQRLVIQGVYRYVRNPMISGVLFVLLGESGLTASVPLFRWFVAFAVINAVYIPLFEEPMLVNRFGEEYLTYKRNVPRWLPRMLAVGRWGGRPFLNGDTPEAESLQPSREECRGPSGYNPAMLLSAPTLRPTPTPNGIGNILIQSNTHEPKHEVQSPSKMPNARTGKVPIPLTLTGTAKKRAPPSGSRSSPVMCSTIGISSPRSVECTGRVMSSVSSML